VLGYSRAQATWKSLTDYNCLGSPPSATEDTLSASMATRHPRGFPPNVDPCSPGLICSITSSSASTADTWIANSQQYHMIIRGVWTAGATGALALAPAMLKPQGQKYLFALTIMPSLSAGLHNNTAGELITNMHQNSWRPYPTVGAYSAPHTPYLVGRGLPPPPINLTSAQPFRLPARYVDFVPKPLIIIALSYITQ